MTSVTTMMYVLTQYRQFFLLSLEILVVTVYVNYSRTNDFEGKQMVTMKICESSENILKAIGNNKKMLNTLLVQIYYLAQFWQIYLLTDKVDEPEKTTGSSGVSKTDSGSKIRV